MAEWVAVCRRDEIRDGRGVSRDAAGLRLAVFRVGDEVVALLKSKTASLNASDKEKPEDWGDGEVRYISVGE